MIKKLSKSIREYKTTALLTPLYMIGEVAMEVLIPTLMALIIDNGVYNSDISYIVKLSILIVVAAILSMAFGIMGAKKYKQTEFDFIMGDASAGEKARALKSQLNSIKISDYSLENVDEFMAEAFTSHEIGTVHTEYEKRVMDIIIKYFKK